MIYFKNQLPIVKSDYFHKTGKNNNLLKIYVPQKNGIKQHLETERMELENPHWHYDSFIAKELPKQ